MFWNKKKKDEEFEDLEDFEDEELENIDDDELEDLDEEDLRDDFDDDFDDGYEDSIYGTRRKNGKKTVIIASAVIALCIAAAAVAVLMYMKVQTNPEYKNAVTLMSAGRYTEAAEIFESLNGYSDSEELARMCRYSNAEELLGSGRFEEAADAFGALGSYSDSEQLKAECEEKIKYESYKAVLGLIDEGQYEEAVTQLETFGDYKDAAQQIEKCRSIIAEEEYQSLLAGIEGADPLTAISVLESANGYGDSAERIEAIKNSPEYYVLQFAEYEAGDRIMFGSYEQDNDTSNGAEAIEWIVLDKNENGLMLISAYILDARAYDNVITTVTWETSDMRKWLNGDFYDAAFSGQEKSVIALTHNSTPGNVFRTIPGGNDTDDYVYLMSFEEAGALFASDAERCAQVTDYARARGARWGDEIRENTQYWLRTPGWDNSFAVYVHSNGSVKNHDSWQNYDRTIGVRPCITIKF